MAKIRPLRRWSDQLPAIYEQCRGPSHGQLFGLPNGSVHFRLGRFGVDAALQLQSIKLFPLGELQHFAFQIVGIELALVFISPVEIVPERGRVLLEDAPAGHCRRLGPGVNLVERQVLEIEPHVRGISREQVRAQGLGFIFAIGAFEIAEHHDHHGCARSAEAGLKIGAKFLQLRLERILIDVVNRPTQDFLPVLRNVERLVRAGLARRRVHFQLVETG